MRNHTATWLICLSLVFTRLVGLHLHACACVEPGVQHASVHYADNGLVFGEHHAGDDEHDVEVDLAVALAAKIKSGSDDGLALPSFAPIIGTPQAQLTTISARGPPSVLPSRPSSFTPPPRGPPHSLA